MFKKYSTWFIFLAILAIFASSYAFDTSTLEARNGNQTVPTRTPSGGGGGDGGGGGNNSGGGGDNNGGGGGSTEPTATVTPAPTATAIPVTIAPTPEGGYQVVETCGPAIFYADQSTVNVRRGPGIDYESIGSLVYLEVRSIIGRAATTEWWYISLPNGTNGWVADIAGSALGIIDGLPALNDDGSPVSSASWNPTPNPACPTATPSPTPPPPTATPAPVDTAVPVDTPAPTETAPPTETALPTETATFTPEPTATSVPPTVASSSADVVGITPTAAPVSPEDPPANGPNWFVISGLALLALGGGAFFYQRRTG